MSNWEPKKVSGEYNPSIGSNVPPLPQMQGQDDATYADTDMLRGLLESLIDEVRELERRLEEELSLFAMPVGTSDAKLIEAHLKEWPSDLGNPGDKISYRYYKALRLRRSTSAEYIRKRYEEAARGVKGTNAIDILAIAILIRDEALLVRDFIDANIYRVDDSSEFRVLELFQDWVESALVGVREFWQFFEERKETKELFPPNEVERASREEAKQGQAFFKVKLNSYNASIHKDIEFLQKNFSEFAPTFYNKFLGPALSYRLKVGRKIMPTGNAISHVVEEGSKTLDANLRTALADQRRRKDLFSNKIIKIREEISERDKYRDYVQQFASKGTAIDETAHKAMVISEEREVEIDYWRRYEQDQGAFIPRAEDSTMLAPHSFLDNLAEGNDHPQYLLRSGGTITGDIPMDTDVKIDGMDPSIHRHTGEDGTEKIHGSDIIDIPEGSLDTTKPPAPHDLRVVEHKKTTIPPGATVINTTVEWKGSTDYSYEVQVAEVRDE